MNYLPMNLTLYFITEITLIDIKKLWNKLIIPEQSAFTDQLILLYLYCYPLSSRLYCRLRSFTESAFRLVGFTTGREFHPALKFIFNLCVYNNPFPPGCQVRFYHSPDRPPRCKSRISDNWLIFSRISLRVIPSLKVRSSKTSALLRPPSIKKQSVLLHFR